jgi:hypothetical protein
MRQRHQEGIRSLDGVVAEERRSAYVIVFEVGKDSQWSGTRYELEAMIRICDDLQKEKLSLTQENYTLGVLQG